MLVYHGSNCDIDKIQPTRHQIAELLIDDIISEMAKFLMEDYGYSLEKALNEVYTSKTLELLQNEETELYIQSPSYNYDILIKEKGLYPTFDYTGSNGIVAEPETT